MGLIGFKQIVIVMILSLCVCSFAGAAEFDHVHLMADDTKAAAGWYAKHFGGEVTKMGPFEVIEYGDMVLKFKKIKEGQAVKPSVSSVLDHIGFSVDDVQGKLDELAKDGATVKGPAKRLEAAGVTFGFAVDPWGTKIEVIDDKDTLGFHHVHLNVAEPGAALEWYQKAFGGEIKVFKGIKTLKGIRYRDNWLIVGKARNARTGTAGTSVDHLGWKTTDLDRLNGQLKKKGVMFIDGGPKRGKTFYGGFVVSPNGVRIEVQEKTPE